MLLCLINATVKSLTRIKYRVIKENNNKLDNDRYYIYNFLTNTGDNFSKVSASFNHRPGLSVALIQSEKWVAKQRCKYEGVHICCHW